MNKRNLLIGIVDDEKEMTKLGKVAFDPALDEEVKLQELDPKHVTESLDLASKKGARIAAKLYEESYSKSKSRISQISKKLYGLEASRLWAEITSNRTDLFLLLNHDSDNGKIENIDMLSNLSSIAGKIKAVNGEVHIILKSLKAKTPNVLGTATTISTTNNGVVAFQDGRADDQFADTNKVINAGTFLSLGERKAESALQNKARDEKGDRVFTAEELESLNIALRHPSMEALRKHFESQTETWKGKQQEDIAKFFES